jgi:hypothetical protein
LSDFSRTNAGRLLRSYIQPDGLRTIESVDPDASGRLRTLSGEFGDHTTPFKMSTALYNDFASSRSALTVEAYHGDSMLTPMRSFLALRNPSRVTEIAHNMTHGTYSVAERDLKTSEPRISVFDHLGNLIR